MIKLKTLNQDDIILLAVNHFGSEWIENSKKVLFDLCPNSPQRYVAHKGPQKDLNNVKSCLKLLNEVGESIPGFVSHNVDKLPPVTFNSLDVSCLLGKIERLSMDISVMKWAMSAQTDICEDLCVATADINQRLCVIEQPGPGRGNVSVSKVNEEVQSQGLEAHALLVCEQPCSAAPQIGEEAPSRHLEGAAVRISGASALDAGVAEGITDEESRVVKEGRRQKFVSENIDVRPTARLLVPLFWWMAL